MYEVEDHHWWYVGLHELVLAVVDRESKRLGRPLRIFDAGCGTGRLCQLLTSHGHDVSGCDASDEAINLCRERGIKTVYKADLNTIDLEADAFDVITSMDVLYHAAITDDIAVLRRLHWALKPGGLLLLNLVAHEFLRSSHDIAVHTRERYNTRTLSERLSLAGFADIHDTYRVSALFPLITLYRMVQKLLLKSNRPKITVASDLKPPNPVVNNILTAVMTLENRVLTHCRLPFGSSVFTGARKHHA